ncbi:MAG: hypothetical protein O3A96_06495 [Proteobacteria bacterium]|nr:hypothetical protein [Pseudomonadota bacterium]
MERKAFDYAPATVADCVAAAERFAAAGNDWHNHVLKPDCLLNPHPGLYGLVIENTTTGEILAYFDKINPIAEEKYIVELRHGKNITQSAGSDGGDAAKTAEPALLGHARALTDEGADWHHHMLMPGCIFNPNPGRYTITLEKSGGGAVLDSHISDDEPDAVLREVEHLFFTKEGVG